MICCVRSATRTASSLGSASASSMPLVCRLCVPPSTAASAWIAIRATLFSGSCAVRETPAVWVWKRSSHERGFFAPKWSRISVAQILRAARYLAISSKKSLCALKKKDRRGAKESTSRPRSIAQRTYSVPSRIVKASSSAAVAPASRMW